MYVLVVFVTCLHAGVRVGLYVYNYGHRCLNGVFLVCFLVCVGQRNEFVIQNFRYINAIYYYFDLLIAIVIIGERDNY